MKEKTLKDMIDVAAGRKKADLVIKNAQVVNVFTHEIIHCSVALQGGKIAGLGTYEGREELDIGGKFIIPGLIDSHVHIESSLLTPQFFAETVIPFGTTTVVADPHEIANVLGAEGIEFMIEDAKNAPLNVFYMVPSCVPATSFENSGAVLDSGQISELLKREGILGLGEMMDFPSVVQGEAETIAKLMAASEGSMPIDGHSPMLEGKGLNAYRAAGIRTDHECSTVVEMQDRLRLGMNILIREGSAARNLSTLIQGVNQGNLSRCAFCTDDKHPEDILNQGHIDHCIRLAVNNGMDPISAVQMASLNPAQIYGLHGKGAIAPGYDADLVVVDNLRHFQVEEVFISGDQVYSKTGKAFSASKTKTADLPKSFILPKLDESSFALHAKQDLVKVIHIHPGSLITEASTRKVFLDDAGNFAADPRLDIVTLAVVERHKGTGNIGLGLVEGLGIKNGTIASSIAHDSHNIICAGSSKSDMLMAVKGIETMGGGIIAVKQGKILGQLPLPIAGLLTAAPAKEVSAQMAEMNRIAWDELQIPRNLEAYMTLSFLALPVIPELKLTDKGLFDVRSFEFVDLEA
jgi:adenine deaminase